MTLLLQVRDVEAVVRRFKTDLHNCVGYIQDPKLLKESIRALYQKHVQEDIVSFTVSFLHCHVSFLRFKCVYCFLTLPTNMPKINPHALSTLTNVT